MSVYYICQHIYFTEADLEDKVEQCYRDGLDVVVVVDEKFLLWKYYLQWCRERVENDLGTDTTRLRVSPCLFILLL